MAYALRVVVGAVCLQKLEVLLQHMFDEADGELQDEDESYFEDISVRSRSNGNGEAGRHGNDDDQLQGHVGRLVSDSNV